MSEDLHQRLVLNIPVRKNIEKQPTIFSFKIQSHQTIPTRVLGQRVDFAKHILIMMDNEGFDVGCIWFTDEAHFQLNGFMNKQNWRFWGSENIHLCEEKPLYSPKVTAWVAVYTRGLIALFTCDN